MTSLIFLKIALVGLFTFALCKVHYELTDDNSDWPAYLGLAGIGTFALCSLLAVLWI